ncbi:hypothetical protein DR864_28110 [Runella rosea]|uniref:Uncharacterized protein n=1 Tax=Runella rosea TaxID=2259595 RepID=A0A344TC91_9BACT|nr:hypothetical protein [Runella rosea]AXE16262.1 hypothetical protein DR864_00245 [Runella rosea]AXE21329.1 hypothetical protein DR864_28110 [Runella rosea]
MPKLLEDILKARNSTVNTIAIIIVTGYVAGELYLTFTGAGEKAMERLSGVALVILNSVAIVKAVQTNTNEPKQNNASNE